MVPPRALSWLSIFSVLTFAAGVLGWLLLVFVRSGENRHSLPNRAGSTVEWLADPANQHTRETVAQIDAAAWRLEHRAGIDTYAATKWVKVTLRNPGAREQRGVLANEDYFMDEVQAWWPVGAAWADARSGEAVPAKEKPIVGREAAFPLTVPAGGEMVVYLRVRDAISGTLRLVWWPEQSAFQSVQTRRALAEGIYFGGLFALLGYNLLLWLRLRIADIGFYVLYLGSCAVFIVLARAQLPAAGVALGSPWLEMMLVIALAATFLFLTQFARVFLDLTTAPTRWPHRVTRGLQVLAGFVVITALLTPWMHDQLGLRVAVLAGGVTHATLFVLAVIAWWRGVRTAKFFLAAFGCLFAGSLPAVVMWFHGPASTEAAVRGLMIGSGLEMLLLSLATADRFAQAQRRIIAETEQRRTMEEAYADELETEVRERTRELSESNADKDRMLAVIGHDLRSPLTGLMKSAIRPSADFARETASTSRALLLMIEDLVLWARMRTGPREFAAHPVQALLQPAVALHRALADSSGTVLKIEVPENLRVGTDLVLAQTLVRNLLANALKFARTHVVLRAESGADGVHFSMSNDGEPLPAEIVARLAADENGPVTATGGLGLRLCREICVALGMKLEARAPAEGGAEFAFTLPAADDLSEVKS